ncbi:hypothetical protein QUO_4049 [Clostridioides difficile P64]|nr:hypothetical protein QUO_4049 [Clostridioides difficile P64]
MLHDKQEMPYLNSLLIRKSQYSFLKFCNLIEKRLIHTNKPSIT